MENEKYAIKVISKISLIDRNEVARFGREVTIISRPMIE
jgi:hypothetical protein